MGGQRQQGGNGKTLHQTICGLQMFSVKEFALLFIRLRLANLIALDPPMPLRKPAYMFPIRDHNPSQNTPYVTYVLMAANIIVFLSYWPLFSDDVALSGFFATWALIPAQVTDGQGLHTLITSMFLHGGLLHLGGNMLFLWIFGDNLEDELGHVGFAIFYLICGIAAGLFQWLADPLSGVPTVGASGAIAGVMGGYLLLFPRARVDILFIFIIIYKILPVPAWVMLVLWFALQLFSGVVTDTSTGGVAYWAHAGGFIIGFLYVIPIWRRKGGRNFWRRTQGQPPHPQAEYKFQKSHIPRIRKRR